MKKSKKAVQDDRRAPGGSATALSEAPIIEDSVTLVNLQVALAGECNAHVRYLAFAREADEEGYAPVASLFRAAARAEAIHARNHREVIVNLGFAPKETEETPSVRSTLENLETAIRGEVYERDEMYPTFVRQARADGSHSAARTFHLAQKAEAEHAALFTQARKDLERLRGEAVDYYVCPVCGFTTAKDELSRCPVCSTPSDRFERVS